MQRLINVALLLGGLYLILNPETFAGAETVGWVAFVLGAVWTVFGIVILLLAGAATAAAASASKPRPRRRF